MGKPPNEMAIFNSYEYVSLPKGTPKNPEAQRWVNPD